MKDDLQEIIDFIRKTFKAKNDQIIPLHEPRFVGNEKNTYSTLLTARLFQALENMSEALSGQ